MRASQKQHLTASGRTRHGELALKFAYGALSVAGLLLPYSYLVLWLLEHGINISKFLADASATRIGAFAWADVLVSGVVVVGFIVVEGSRIKLPRKWLPIAGTCAVGPSFGLPLFLLLREIHLSSEVASATH